MIWEALDELKASPNLVVPGSHLEDSRIFGEVPGKLLDHPARRLDDFLMMCPLGEDLPLSRGTSLCLRVQQNRGGCGRASLMGILGSSGKCPRKVGKRVSEA